MDAFDPASISIGILIFLTAAGFLAGFIDSVAGGGGLLSLPALLVAGLPPQSALATSKFMATWGTAVSVWTYARNKVILWKVGLIGSVFSLAGSALGTKTALWVDNAVLGKVILVLLPIAALITFFPMSKNRVEKEPGAFALYLITPLVCTAVGFYDGFFGPGTGSFMLLGLHIFLGIGLLKASGTAKVFNLASNFSSLVVFLLHGKVIFLAGIPMAVANILGNVVGCRMALAGGPTVVRRMLLLSLALLFATLVWRYYA